MSTAITIRIDDDAKAGMERACEGIGISMSAAFNIYAKRVAREQRIPFDVSAGPDPTEYEKAILRDVDDFRAGRLETYSIDEVREHCGLEN